MIFSFYLYLPNHKKLFLMKNINLIITLFFIYNFSTAQGYKDYEIGVEIGNISFSNMGSAIDLAGKFAIVDNEELAYGPIFRYKFIRSVNVFQGFEGSASFIGFGGFLHYRLMDWFYLGAEMEYNQNPFRNNEPQKRWNFAGFLGGGIHRELIDDALSLNAGLMFDVVDALRDPFVPSNPSNFSQYYFIRRNNPTNPQQQGQFVPLIYRITFHIHL